MKKFLFLFSLVCLGLFNTVQAQDEVVSDEELDRYVVMMDSINGMRKHLLSEIKDAVNNNENVSNSRYNELSKILDDEEKLKAANATEVEINFIQEIQKKKEDGTTLISETFKTLAKDYVGASSYNKIRRALKGDPSVKSRYDSKMAELASDEENEEVQ